MYKFLSPVQESSPFAISLSHKYTRVYMHTQRHTESPYQIEAPWCCLPNDPRTSLLSAARISVNINNKFSHLPLCLDHAIHMILFLIN